MHAKTDIQRFSKQPNQPVHSNHYAQWRHRGNDNKRTNVFHLSVRGSPQLTDPGRTDRHDDRDDEDGPNRELATRSVGCWFFPSIPSRCVVPNAVFEFIKFTELLNFPHCMDDEYFDGQIPVSVRRSCMRWF